MTARARDERGPTTKRSVSLRADDVAWAEREAKRTRRSFSAVLSDALHVARQSEARDAVLRYLGDSANATPKELAAIMREWKG